MNKNTFPKTLNLNGAPFTFRLMTAADRDRVLAFARLLTEPELSFMRRDITRPDAVDAWIEDLNQQKAISILVEDDLRLAGYGTLYFNQFFWNRHLAEVRIMVSANYRNRGLGTRLTSELMLFAQELGLEKVLSYMALDDPNARRMLEAVGFKPEAVLAGWVKTRDNRTHDLLIMSMALHDVHA